MTSPGNLQGRLRLANERPPRPDGAFVLYWMTANRRLAWNYALDHAVHRAQLFRKPLVVLEALRCDYAWASDRFHRFVLDGMREHRARLQRGNVSYYPYVEPGIGAGKGLLRALAERAVLIVGDDWPGFLYPRMLAAAAGVPARLELVDSAGLLPVGEADRAYPTALAFRRRLQRVLPEHLGLLPQADPLRAALPGRPALPSCILRRWPPAGRAELAPGVSLDALPIDGHVRATGLTGGHRAARVRLDAFLEWDLPRYLGRNDPSRDATSRLSPYLHFGHIGPHEVLHTLAEREEWTPDKVASAASGKRSGWWGMSEAAEGFLDQLVTWRELGLNAAALLPAYDEYETLPDWARHSLEAHDGDPRRPLYTRPQLEVGATHDALWNAAQNQLVREGGPSTATSECCGARRSSSGARRRVRRWLPCSR